MAPGKILVESLMPGDIGAAYALARMAVPGLEPLAWQRFYRFHLKRSHGAAGILTAKHASRAHLCGMVSYRCEADLAAGRVLRADRLVAIDLLDPVPIQRALLESLARLAQQHCCRLIRLLALDINNTHLLAIMREMMPAARWSGVDLAVQFAVPGLDLDQGPKNRPR